MESGASACIRSAADWLKEARAYEREGELFKAYDIAAQGLANYPDDRALKHRAVLCLARAGATRLAREKYASFGLAAGAASDEDIAALSARLSKDEALAAAPGRRATMAAEAAAEYAAIFAATGGYYPAINAATLTLLAGDEPGAERLARDVLAVLDKGGDTDYYALATRMEALLLLGDVAAAHALVPAALKSNGGDHAARATTWKQLRLVLDQKRLDPALFLEDFAPPKVIHFLGHMISPPGEHGRFDASEEEAVRAQIEAYLDRSRAGFGYGSLASGADIMFAEALLQRGASVHVVLPFEQREFVETSVQPAGESWVARFETCLAAASSVRFATEDRYLGDDRLFAYCSRLAMGLAVLRAQHLGSEVEQAAIWDHRPSTAVAGTAVDIEWWRANGLPQTIIPCGSGQYVSRQSPDAALEAGRRVIRAMLFCDIKGFSKLTDMELPSYVNFMLGALGQVVDPYGASVKFANTWGDGLFLVFEDPAEGARCALDLQDAISRLDFATVGLPAHMGMRIGGHLGPAFAAPDPILRKTNYFGAHVSRAARIEPVTPEGCVYVTEPFAAVLALDHGGEFVSDYVGMTESAKKYGAMRMFLLRRRTARAE